MVLVLSRELLHNIRSYQRLVRQLLYLTIIHSDIAYAISIVNQVMHTPRIGHLNVVVHMILEYLKKSTGQGILCFQHGHLVVEAYIDSEWAEIEDVQLVIVPW